MNGLNDKNAKAFMAHMKRVCLANEVSFRPVSNSYVIMTVGRTRLRCAGYFAANSSTGPVLSFATELPFKTWFRVAIHEFGHLEQWLEDFQPSTGDLRRKFWQWLNNNIELTPEEIRVSVKAVRDREYDAEKRTLAAIEKYKLPLDPIDAAKHMNWYLYSFQYAATFRFWVGKDISGFNNEALVDAMPEKLSDDYDTLNHEILQLFSQTYHHEIARMTRKRVYSAV